MAVTDRREVVIEATPEEILDVIADVEGTSEWSPQHQGAEVLSTYDDGRPKEVKMKVKSAGITDEQVGPRYAERLGFKVRRDARSCTLVRPGITPSPIGPST